MAPHFEDCIPLSLAQHAVWFDQLRYPETPIYHVGGFVSIRGNLDNVRFLHALTCALAAQPGARVAFSGSDDAPCQVVLPIEEPVLPFHDFSHLNDPEATARSWMAEHMAQPFARSGPLYRFALLRLGPDHHYWVKTYHHLAFDGWSIALLARLVARFYNHPTEPRENLAYAAICAEDARYCGSESEARDRRFWLAHLHRRPDPVPARFFAARHPQGPVPAGFLSFTIEGVRYAAINHMLRETGCSPLHFFIALACCRFARGGLTAGVPLQNRRRTQRDVAGMLTTILPVYLEPDPAIGFVALMRHVRTVLRACFRHRRYPIHQLQRDLGLDPSGDERLYDLRVSYEKHDYAFHLAGSPVHATFLPNGFSPSALAIAVREYHGSTGFCCDLEFSLAAFTPDAAATLPACFLHLIDQIIASPKSRTDQLQRITPEQRTRVLADFGHPSLPEPTSAPSLMERFARQVRASPHKTALDDGAHQLTYAELAGRVSDLAARLSGDRESRLIALHMARGPDLVVAMLAVLHAGAAYIPLDPSWPDHRLQQLLDDAGPDLVLTDREEWSMGNRPTATLKAVMTWPEQPHRPIPAEAPAYLIWTSGTTGTPKGVVIPHDRLAALLAWSGTLINRNDTVFAATSTIFDLSVFELFASLACGATVVLGKNLLALPEHEARHRVTLINTVPSAMRALLDGETLPHSVRTVCLAGEALDAVLVKRLYALGHVHDVYNLYGPSEDTVYSTWSRVPEDPDQAPSIGRPLPGTRTVIVDERMEPVAAGLPGELCLAGTGLAYGYRHAPERTAVRFVPNPYGTTPGDRLYRTGDRARYLPDGSIAFMGRLDQQVKVRGFRIEPGEIENTLRAYRDTADAVVAAVSRQEDTGLIAWIQPVGGAEENVVTRLQHHLETRLPHYMIPDRLVLVDQLPRLPNGKIDRRSLTLPGPSVTPQDRPRSPLEAALIEMWNDLLETPGHGRHDHFFRCGGHSLLAARLLTRIRTRFGIRLPFSTLFRAATPAGLAAVLEPEAAIVEEAVRPPDNEPSRACRRLWFLDRLAEEPRARLAWNMACRLDINGSPDPERLQHAFTRVIARHRILRTVFPMIDDRPGQVLSDNLPVLVIHNPDGSDRTARHHLEREIAWTPFDLEHGPLLRAALVCHGPDRCELFLAMHHIISDGWSFSLLLRELAAFYHTPDRQLPEPPQYAEVVGRDGDDREAPVFWSTYLAHCPTGIELPLDHPRPERKSWKGATLRRDLPAPLGQELIAFCHQHELTVFMAFVTALDLLLHRWTGADDLVIGTVDAGRRNVRAEQCLGCFMNFLAIRVQATVGQSGRDLINHVRTVTTRVFDHPLDFDQVVEVVNPERTGNRMPLYNVALLLQNHPAPPPFGGDVAVTVAPLMGETALLDLRWVVHQQGTRLVLELEYDTDLFDLSTAQALIDALPAMLQHLMTCPDQPLASAPLPEGLTTGRSRQVTLAASFTAEPLAPYYRHWMTALDPGGELVFAPYNQVLQQWLDPTGLPSARPGDINVLMVRPGDRLRDAGSVSNEEADQLVVDYLDELATTITQYPPQVPTLLLFCPDKTTTPGSRPARYLERIAAALDDLPDLYVMLPDDLDGGLVPEERDDPISDELGALPYTDSFYAVLGTILARRVRALTRPPYKVIVLDCDGTLWDGVCAEDGPRGVRIEAGHRAFQQKLSQCQQEGMLLCLCSKNRPEDVRAVFEHHPDMVLTWSQCVDTRINWLPKSENLAALADALDLGLDSFIFLDDNPLEIAEVRANRPEVLAVTLPESDRLETFSERFWAFDRHSVSQEDRQRTELYRAHRQRQRLQAGTTGLADFIAGLELNISFHEIDRNTMERAIQLMQRTNQFNASGRVFTPGELVHYPAEGTGLVVRVRDRFGDYGTVGVLLYRPDGQRIIIEVFLLSCRALGRGVEHAMLAECARCHPGRPLEVAFRQTARNQPVRDFLERHGTSIEAGYRFESEVAATLRFDGEMEAISPSTSSRATVIQRDGEDPVVLERIARISGSLTALIGRQRQVTSSGFVPARTPLEQGLCDLFHDVTDGDRIGVHDDFFALGGESLGAVRLTAMIRRAFAPRFPLHHIFDYRTPARLAGLISQQSESDRGPAVRIIENGQGPVPLYASQHGLWLAHQRDPDSLAWHVGGTLLLSGVPDVAALVRSLHRLVERHDALRTVFRMHQGEPHAFVQPVPQGSVVTEDGAAIHAQPFHLEEGPLYRFALEGSGTLHAFHFAFHHIIADAWSSGVLLRDMARFYRQETGSEAPDATGRITIPHLIEEVDEKDRSFWRNQLHHLPVRIALPFDAPDGPSPMGRRIPFRLDPERLALLSAMGNRQGATLFMTFHALFCTLLHRYSEQTDLALGSLVVNRDHPDLESAIGPLVNTLILRCDLSGDPDFIDLLGRVRDTDRAAYEHGHYPFHEVVRDQGSSGRSNGLINVMLDFYENPLDAITLPGLTISAEQPEREPVRADLALHLYRRADALEGFLLFRDDIETGAMETMVRQLGILIDAVLDHPRRPLSQLPLNDDTACRRLRAWSGGKSGPVSETSPISRIAEMAADRPDRPALIVPADDTTAVLELSYGALWQRVEQWASSLVSHGLGHDDVIAICLPRSPQMVIAILALQRAGAAWLPVDPELPRRRMAYMVQQAAAIMVICEAGSEIDGDVRVIHSDRFESMPQVSLPDPPAADERAAYVMFTSGSTGDPKGVVISQSALTNYLDWMAQVLPLTPDDGVLQKTPYHFDAFIWELFGPLMAGARIVLAAPGDQRDPVRINEHINRHGVTVLKTVPAQLNLLLNEPSFANGAALRAITCGGEAMSHALQQRCRQLVPPLTLLYGPTEATVNAAWFRFDPEHTPFSCLGQPIDGTRLFLLDHAKEPVPVGCPGELYIAGRGLARGYCGQPEHTAARFIPNPFATDLHDTRLYRTGDRARYRHDGVLVFLGRSDRQVKLHGHRIEPGEIEAVLCRFPTIDEAMVRFNPKGPGGSPCLEAAYAGKTGRPDITTLRSWLKTQLPASLVPARLIPMAALPRTAVGKLDARAFHAPVEVPPASRPPQTTTEEILHVIWTGVLGRELGCDDNFFEIGGDSINAIQVVSEARNRGLDLRAGQLFSHQTIGELAATHDRQPHRIPFDRDQKSEETGGSEALPLSPAQHGMLLHAFADTWFRQFACTFVGPLDVDCLVTAWSQVIARHEALRAGFFCLEDNPAQIIVNEIHPEWHIEDLSDWDDERITQRLQAFLEADRRRGCPPDEPPLLRFALFRVDPNRYRFIWSHHHLITDGWSSSLIFREVLTLYAAHRRDQEPELPTAPSWRRCLPYLTVTSEQQAEDWWRKQLAGFEEPTVMPGHTDSPPQPGIHSAHLTEDEALTLIRMARELRITPAILLQAAWGLLLARHTNTRDVVFGLLLSGRPAEVPHIAETVGALIHTVPVRMHLDETLTLSEWLTDLHRTALERAPFTALPPARFTTWSNVPSGNPLYHALFIFENYPALQDTGQVPELSIRSIDHDDRTHTSPTLIVRPEGETFELALHHDGRATTDPATLLLHYRHLIRCLCADMGQRLSHLSVLPDEARTSILSDWNATRVHRDQHNPCESIARNVRRQPEAIALIEGERSLTYEALWRRSGTLAARLQQLDIGPERLVAICQDRSMGQVVSLLAVMRCGAAWLPLDPELPLQRRRTMLDEARPSALITEPHHTDLAGDIPLVTEEGGEPVAPAPVHPDPDNPAYVIFTSGSTGRPKAAVIGYAALYNRLAWMQEAYGLKPQERVLRKTPYGFDVSIWEFFWPLISGAGIVIARPGGHRDPLYLFDLVRDQRVDVLHFVPSMLRAFLETLTQSWSDHDHVPRLVICSGEALDAPLRDRFFAMLPRARLENLYGPTEAAIDVSSWSCQRVAAPASVPIGTPVANIQLHVLDHRMEPVPPGVIGALYIGGTGLARGYLNRPELTAERFIPNPFLPGARLYHTGDLAAWRPDGVLLFHGRSDHQLKLRGFRIEPGEIEAALCEIPQVQDAVVLCQQGDHGDPMLVAHLRASGTPDPERIRTCLAERLPAYMVPGLFRFWEQFPLTPNGKLDRRVMMTTGTTLPDGAGRQPTLPRTPIETTLCRIWATCLARQQVGIHDHFFALGGDSIVAIRVLARARAVGLAITAANLFDHPTIAELAPHVVTLSRITTEEAPPVGDVPLTPIQQRFFAMQAPNPNHYNQALGSASPNSRP